MKKFRVKTRLHTSSLRLYANAHLNTHPFVNNIPVPEELKTYDLDYVKNQLLSGLKDKVEWNFYDNEDIEFWLR